MVTRAPDQLDAFERITVSVPTSRIAGMVHGTDPVESQVAAVKAEPYRRKLQQRILECLARYGPMNVLELEALADLRDVGVYSVRRRASELRKAGRVVQVGRKDGAAILDLPTTSTESDNA